MPRFDIRRQKRNVDTALGGVTIQTTAIETRFIDLQHMMRGADELKIGGRAIEANYRGFMNEDSDIEERDIITPDSGTTNYEVVFVQSLWSEHVEILVKRVQI